MATYLYIATAIGLFIAAQTDGKWKIVTHTLRDHSVTSIAASDDTILAGTTKGIWRSVDNGTSWHAAEQNVTIGHVRWLDHVPSSKPRFLAGTEPAGIYVSTDKEHTWNGSAEVSDLRDARGWFLPYSPEAGCVRGFGAAKSDNHQFRIYAAVEVGGVLISDDFGESWRLVAGSDGNPDMNRDLGRMVHPDVHSIIVHPTVPNLVLAATGGGLFHSTDGGRSWKNIYPSYIRAVWVDPADPLHVIAGPADGVSRRGRIEESFDGGQNWRPASDGMLPAPWERHMVERFYEFDNTLFAVLSNGELWARSFNESNWHRILPELTAVNAVTGIRK